MATGQPYIPPTGLSRRSVDAPALLAALFATLFATACGSTSVTDLTGPDEVRCAASITAEPDTVPAAGGSITISVASERDCTWSARSDTTWLQVRSASGQGHGTFAATAASNDQPATRTGSIVVNDQRLTITQDARACIFVLQGPSNALPADGGSAAVQVSTIGGCAWTASSSAPWLVIRTASGTGPGSVPFDVAPNPGPEREASIAVGGQTFVVTQRALAPACTFAITPPARAFPVSGGEGTVTVTTAPGCTWTVSGGTEWTEWLTTSGTGSGQAQYRVQPNPSIASRLATLTVAGRVHTVNQDGVVCTIDVTPRERSVPAAGGTGLVDISTLPGCPWTATSNAGWLLLGAASGSGSGSVTYDVLANPLTDGRTARITIGGQAHTVTQAAAAPPCTYELDPISRTFTAASATGVVRVVTQAGCGWTATSGVEWATIEPGPASGTGTADVTYTVAENTTAAERSGTLTIGGQSHAITQEAAAPACAYTVDPPMHAFSAAGGGATVTVTTAPGCAWNAESTVPWAVLVPGPSSGAGTTAIEYTVEENTTTAERTGSIAIGGESHLVSQAAAEPVCSYTLDPAARSLPAGAAAESVQVITGPGCEWAATSNDSWITVTSPPTGSGTDEISYTVAENTTTDPRIGTVTIAGQTHTVTQAASVAVACTYSLDPPERLFEASGGTGTVDVRTQPACDWLAVSSASWISVLNTRGVGDSQVRYEVASASSSADRTAMVVVNGETHTVTQHGSDFPGRGRGRGGRGESPN